VLSLESKLGLFAIARWHNAVRPATCFREGHILGGVTGVGAGDDHTDQGLAGANCRRAGRAAHHEMNTARGVAGHRIIHRRGVDHGTRNEGEGH